MSLVNRIESKPSWQLTQVAWLNLARMPAYSLPTLIFPLVFYTFFGLVMIPQHAQWMLVTFAVFGILGTALFAFGVGVAMERAEGWWLLLRAAPTPFAGVVIGKMVAVLTFSLIIVTSMAWLAAGFGGVRMATSQWLILALVLVIGGMPFCLLGLALGLWLSPNAAPAVINILYLPLGFLSGLWIPVTQLPGTLQALAAWLPPYHLAGLALHVSGTQPANWPFHLAVLLAYTLLFTLLAALAWRRFKGA